jgi:uncharacterized damage-inducible protein DinB
MFNDRTYARKTLTKTIVLATWCLAAAGAAEGQGTPVSDALRSSAQRAGRNLVAAAEEMPAAKYAFKPTKAQMTFGEVIVHLSGGNDFLCSHIAGVEAPKRADLSKGAPKDKLVARLRESFRFCDSALADVDDSKLSEKVKYFDEGEITRAAAMAGAVEDWAGHYSQLAVYLRLNGLLPPTAKGRKN